MKHHPLLIPVCLLAAAAATANAQGTPPDFGFTWRTIGDPGNAPVRQSDVPFYMPAGERGAVNYEYRMATTEVTVSQWYEFVLAYTTVYPDTVYRGDIAGDFLWRTGSAGSYVWHMPYGVDNVPMNMSWDYAAKYCNWLCHNKEVSAAAFATGAYDTSTFFPNPGPTQIVHTPGAPFWLPSIDEWEKAMYFDPNKNGSGQPGYWHYEDSSDSVPVGGIPGTPGAQTGAGNYESDPLNEPRQYPVGSYPNAQSPWGMLDGSGGRREWVEGDGNDEFRWLLGSWNLETDITLDDRIGWEFSMQYYNPAGGFRLASTVPAPGAGVLLLASAAAGMCRRRR